ncbi:MAG: HDOD domain-containing protein [Candidatus Thiodiazotropha sp.]|jgi:HD-like signal output (HDOD) protein
MQPTREAKQQIIMLKQLPPLSATATRLLELLTNENISLEELARVIGQDPTVAARILGVANSAYFGQTQPIHTVEQAIIRVLGLNMVKSLAFSIAISRVFDAAKCKGFDLEAHWFRSLMTAMLSREICRRQSGFQASDLDAVYLAGLLFDIGTLVLVYLFPDEYAGVIRQLGDTPALDPLQLEEEVVGVNSRQAGAWLTDRWHLPPVVVQVVAQSPKEETRREVAAVSLAADLAARREHSDRELPEVPEHLVGLTQEILADIEVQCRLRDEELLAIASVMAR